ncbi:LytR C-terminal domain-containing protein, partial [Ilumatobacter sp.]|uniref:LytR C-terminal domain-containing protein n=1 Tax=Ilumatobacter sp. TaxID=1967498 RepID=UPI003C5FEBE9
PTVPVEQRTAVRVRVLNAGGPAGSASFTTGILGGEGFDPEGPGDGVVGVDQHTVVFAPGQEIAAATVNQFVNAAPEFVIEANPDDPNWAEFGSNLDVLVLVGPQ